jgi:hypothetical protein
MTRDNSTFRLNRRTVLKTIGVAGTVGALGGIAAADSDEVDREQLRELRRATSKYQDLSKAEEDGYVLDESHCVEGPPGEGNMGFHAVNGPLIDRTLSPSEPEILVYEKQGDQYILVAVEFASMHDEEGPAPEIIGHEMHLVPHLPFNWALHVWAWKNNPNGLFADWNPRVECPY